MTFNRHYAIATARSDKSPEFLSIAHQLPRLDDPAPSLDARGASLGEASLQCIVASTREALENGIEEVQFSTCEAFIANGFSNDLEKWRSNSWRKASGSPLKNSHLWQQLDELANKILITITHCTSTDPDIRCAKAEALDRVDEPFYWADEQL